MHAQEVAYIQTQILCANADIEGMKAENNKRQNRGEAQAYDEDSFFNIPEKYGLHHNQVIAGFERVNKYA